MPPRRAVRDAGNLLTRAGFALPTVDTDTITLYYPSGAAAAGLCLGPPSVRRRKDRGAGPPPASSHISPQPFHARIRPCPPALDVVDHLRGMGETNAQLSRRGFVRRDTALATAAVYDSLFAEESEDGELGVPATFQARRRRRLPVALRTDRGRIGVL